MQTRIQQGQGARSRDLKRQQAGRDAVGPMVTQSLTSVVLLRDR